jgi:hypothetical protein
MDSASRMLGHRRGRRVTWPFSRLFFFFFLAVLGFELRTFAFSHSTSPMCDFFLS